MRRFNNFNSFPEIFSKCNIYPFWHSRAVATQYSFGGFSLLHKNTMSVQCYLWKRARSSGRNWKRRWFVFEKISTGWAISYYKDEATARKNKPPSGAVVLSSGNNKARITQITTAKDYSIEILPGDGASPLVIAAEDSVRCHEILQTLAPYVHNVATGWLYKRARKSGRNWKKRWMEVDFKESVLRIFDDTDDAYKANKLGSSANANDTLGIDARSVVQTSGLRKYCLEVVPQPGDLSLFVAAENAEDFERWQHIFARLTAGAEVRAAPVSTTLQIPATMKKVLSKKGSALFALAVGHVSSTTRRPSSSGPPPSRGGRGPPPRRRKSKSTAEQDCNDDDNDEEDGEEDQIGKLQPSKHTSVPPMRQRVPPARRRQTQPPQRRAAPQRRSLPPNSSAPPLPSVAQKRLSSKTSRRPAPGRKPPAGRPAGGFQELGSVMGEDDEEWNDDSSDDEEE